MRKKMRATVISANAAVFIIITLLILYNSLQILHYALFDYNSRSFMSHRPHGDIVVIGIDEESIQTLGEYPWTRDTYIPLLEELGKPENKPKVIAFDILFTNESDPAIDDALAATMAQYDNIVLPSYADTENRFSRTTTVSKSSPIYAETVVKPIDKFAAVSETALINRVVDADGAVRRTWLQMDTPEGPMPSLAFKAARMYGADVDHYLQLSDPGRNPLSQMTIKYDGETYDFMTIPFSAILNGDVPMDNFKDRIVLVGYTYVGSEADDGITPVEANMKLVYVHANIINQLINQERIVVVPDWVSLALAYALFALIVVMTWKLRTSVTSAVFVLLLAALIFGQHYLFGRYSVSLNVVYPAFALLLAFLANIAIKSYYDARQKNFVTKQFGRYISPDLVAQIVKSDLDIKLGGINKNLTVLFLDVRGFTALSERLKPEEVVDFLNTMFNMITRKALENRGTIDKFIGDAAMILFNAPLDVDNHEYCAVKTACDIQREMAGIQQEIMAKYGVTLSIGIGINTGEVVVGNIGSYLRLDYTAIGDNVNIAARIESSTVANQILVSESTYEKTREQFQYQYIGERAVKGKSVPLKLYEVTGLAETAS